MGKFQISQAFKGAAHDGLDLVGIDSKEIHSTVTGTVVFAGWENPADHSQGFGQYVVVQCAGLLYHFAHLSEIRVKYGDAVKCTDVVGIEGSTGRSTGSHCHYCVRTSMSPGTALDVCAISGIPNDEWGIYDDGYRPQAQAQAQATTPAPDIRALQLALNTEGCMLDVDGICGPKTLAAARKQHIYNGASGEVVRWVQNRLNYLGFDCGAADGIAGTNTMSGVNAWQRAQGVGVGEMYGSDWDVLLA